MRSPPVPLALIAGLFVMLSSAIGQPVPVPNPSFETGQDAPEGWTLSGGSGRWTRHAVQVTGNGEDSNHWRSARLALQPSALYRLGFRARRVGGAYASGTPVSGPTFCNRDLGKIPATWTRYNSVFVTPEDTGETGAFLRFGQWQVNGAIEFDDVQVAPAEAVHAGHPGASLGAGERLDLDRYEFQAPFASLESNYSRPLVSHRCGFNTNRWTFRTGSEVLYCHHLTGRRHRSGSVEVGVTYHRGGELVVEAATDRGTWRKLGAIDRVSTQVFRIPARDLPAKKIRVRLKAHGDRAVLQVGSYAFRSRLVEAVPFFVVGRTQVLAILARRPEVKVSIKDLGGQGTGLNTLHLGATSTGKKPEPAEVRVQVGSESTAFPVVIPPGQSWHWVHYRIPHWGRLPIVISVPEAGYRAVGEIHVPEYFRSDFGQCLLVRGPKVELWWASSGWKIHRQRPPPRTAGRTVKIAAARNESEAVQLVLHGTGNLGPLSARVAIGPLTGPEGAVIPAERLDVLRVRYVRVAQPTDPSGVATLWPDPLPPLEEPLRVEAGTNQPLWIRVRVPRDGIPAGIYRGEVRLDFGGAHRTARVPLEVEVYDFTLPDRMTCTTAFGFSPANVWRYHGLETEADRRAVLARYFENMSRHHVSPYDPAPLDPLRVRWPNRKETDPEKLVPTFDWTAWDRALERAFDHHHFNSIRLRIPGLGGGTFHQRWEPTLLGHAEGTPQYGALFRNYCQALESHLREKGWLDEAFVYWFDEPAPRDYAFVMNGFRKLKAAAPGLNRMLTEQPESALFGGPNIWCPVSHNFDEESARARMKKGETLWWYVCTGPKAPYCTLFIDHPATELRVWLWQTWQRRIKGVLVWATNYWTSTAAYPDPAHPQDPYEDPMSWTSGYSTPKGVKRPWGNGDGRFLYPPEAAATGRPKGPVLDGPVDSIRWEMLRDGIEDYEYLVILKRLLERKQKVVPAEAHERYRRLLEIPASITKSLTDFTKDPRPLERRRDAIARAIADLRAWR